MCDFSSAYSIAMVTCYVKKMTETRSPMTGHLFDTITVVSIEKLRVGEFIDTSMNTETVPTGNYCEPPPKLMKRLHGKHESL